MDKFYKENLEWILVATALLIVIGLLGFYIFGIRVLVQSFNDSLSTPQVQSEITEFNLSEAERLLGSRNLLK